MRAKGVERLLMRARPKQLKRRGMRARLTSGRHGRFLLRPSHRALVFVRRASQLAHARDRSPPRDEIGDAFLQKGCVFRRHAFILTSGKGKGVTEGNLGFPLFVHRAVARRQAAER